MPCCACITSKEKVASQDLTWSLNSFTRQKDYLKILFPSVTAWKIARFPRFQDFGACGIWCPWLLRMFLKKCLNPFLSNVKHSKEPFGGKNSLILTGKKCVYCTPTTANLTMSRLWSTLLNALRKSRYNTSTLSLSSVHWISLSLNSMKFVWHNQPFQKPCCELYKTPFSRCRLSVLFITFSMSLQTYTDVCIIYEIFYSSSCMTVAHSIKKI